MTLNEYQRLAQRTSSTKTITDKLTNGCLGLAGETGEVCDIIKKHLFQGHDLDQKHLAEELGDVLWYVAETARAIGASLDDIAEQNIEKLKKRYPDGFDPDRSVNRDWVSTYLGEKVTCADCYYYDPGYTICDRRYPCAKHVEPDSNACVEFKKAGDAK